VLTARDVMGTNPAASSERGPLAAERLVFVFSSGTDWQIGDEDRPIPVVD